MNVLLLYPEFPDTFWSYRKALRFVGKKAVSPPLGLITIAAMLPGDFSCRLIDLNVRTLRASDIEWADMVFISAMAIQRPSCEALIEACKGAGKPIVAGGPLFTTEADSFPDVDHLILNEAEITLPRFLDDLAHRRAKRVYSTSEHADMTRSPVPAWHLLDKRQYSSMSIQYSRGCPFACEFCSVTAMLGRKPRTKTAQQVIAELDALVAAGWDGAVFFVDDNFIGPRRRVKDELLPELIRWQQRHGPMPLYTQVSIDLADDAQLIEAMTSAGFDTVFIGIETPDGESLGECGKVQNRGRDMAQNVKTLQRAGLEVQGGFIVGFDHDGADTFERQIEFIQRAGIATAMVGLLQAIAGTQLYERLAKERRLIGGSSGDNVDGTTNIVPSMGLEALRSGYDRLLQGIYSPRAYYQRVRTFLGEYQMPKVKLPLSRPVIAAFLRSLFLLGIAGRERLQYWRLLLWTLTHRPVLFPMAVRLAIIGHHYLHLCRQSRRLLASPMRI